MENLKKLCVELTQEHVEKLESKGHKTILPNCYDNIETENLDQETGVQIIKKAIEEPLRQIVENAGKEGSVIVNQIKSLENSSEGYNARTNQYGDMFEQGVIDPAKVTRVALQNAASVASLLITTEATIVTKPEPKNAVDQMNPGMMY